MRAVEWTATPADSHPKGIYTKEDLVRAERNIESHEWAVKRKNQIVKNANDTMNNFPIETAKKFIPRTTPGTTTFCPNCVATGKSWHANGNWAWSKDDPDKLTCNVCGMTFPHDDYKEDRVHQSTFDPKQEFSYISKNGPQKCMYYENCYSSPSAVIRGKKLQYVIQKPLYDVALGYLVTKEEEYAKYVKELLLTLAEVMPKYLVYEGYSYNEYADCNPRDAAKNISALPKECKRITGAGIVEDASGQTLYSEYWSASRLGTSGMDGSTVQKIALAYDFTASSSVYTDDDRAKIEKDVVEEAAYLGFCDSEINNKAVGNRAGVALAGLVIDSHEMARFGLDGFMETVNSWFLDDGGTSESAAYALQTVNGLVVYGKAYRNYSDPDDTTSEPKYNNFNVNTDTRFDQVWQYLAWTLQSNFYYAPLADSYVTSTLGTTQSEYLGVHFPLEENRRLSAERLGTTTPSADSLFHRDPDLDIVADKPYTFPDVVFPYLAQGYVRSGAYGRNSTVILDASDYGSHHHRDSLNLVYWKDGHELLHDLGYLWDHVDIEKTRKTCVHNTVVIDGEDQIEEGRKGSFHEFAIGESLKVMQASSKAYEQAKVYHRTVAQVEHDDQSYLVDIFRVEGGSKQEYVFHFPNMNHQLNPDSDLKFTKPEGQEEVKFIFQINLQSPSASGDWIEVSNVKIQEELPDGSLGEDFVSQQFPDNIEEQESKSCFNDIWCIFLGGKISSVEGKDPGTSGVRFVATSKAGIIVGNSAGYTGENAFTGHLGGRYRISFFMKASTSPQVQFTWWRPGQEGDQNQREWPKMNFDNEDNGKGQPSEVSQTDWIEYTGYVDIDTHTVPSKNGGQTSKAWAASVAIDEDYTLTAFVPATPNEWVYLEKGWGQRNYDNSDKGETLPYYYIQRTSDELTTFVCVYEGYRNGDGIVKAVELEDFGYGNVAVHISTTVGDDYILSSFNGSSIEAFNRVSDCSLSADLSNGRSYALNGKSYESPNVTIENEWKEKKGETESFSNEGSSSWFVISEEIPPSNFTGQALQVTYSDGVVRSYPIFGVESEAEGKTRIYTRKDGVGFRLKEKGSWRLSSFVKVGEPIPPPEPEPEPEPTTSEEELVPPDPESEPTNSEEIQQTSDGSDDGGNPGPDGSGSGLTGGEIAGIVVGAIVAVAAVVAGVMVGLMVYKKRRIDKYSSSETSNAESAASTVESIELE